MNNLKIRTAVLLTLLSLILCSIPFANAYEYPNYEMWKVSDTYSQEDALKIGEKLGIEWIPDGSNYIAKDKGFDVEQLRRGMDVELEHGKRAKITSVTSNNALKTGMVALAHLNEFPTYYEALEQMEMDADAYWKSDHQLPIQSKENLDPVQTFTIEQAVAVGEKLGIKWDQFDKEQFRAGMDIELEHGSVNPVTDVTKDDPLLTGKIVMGHLVEFPDYYNRLYEMEHNLENP